MRASNIIKSSIFDSFWNLEESWAPELHFHVSTYPFEKICNLTLLAPFTAQVSNFFNFWVCRHYSLHQELQFDGSTSLFMIDCNLTLFGASSAEMSGRITNLLTPNNFSRPEYPIKPSFPEKYCIFLKSTLSSRILLIFFSVLKWCCLKTLLPVPVPYRYFLPVPCRHSLQELYNATSVVLEVFSLLEMFLIEFYIPTLISSNRWNIGFHY